MSNKDHQKFVIGDRTSRHQTTNQLLEIDVLADYDAPEPNDTYHAQLCELVKYSDPTIKPKQPESDQFNKPLPSKPACQMVTHARMTNYKHVNLLSDPGPETLRLKTVNYQLRQLLRDRNTAKRQLKNLATKALKNSSFTSLNILIYLLNRLLMWFLCRLIPLLLGLLNLYLILSCL